MRASTPRPIAPQLAVPRRDSHEYLETIRKKTRKPIRITSAASYNREEPAVLNTPSGRRVSWASRAINCCALTTRKKSPPVSVRVPTPLSDECTPTRCKQRTRDDRRAPCEERREPSIFTFDPCAIAAFARETAEREAHGAVTRDCASSRLHASRESIGGASSEENSNAHAAHDSHAPREHINASSQRDSNYFSRLNFEDSSLRIRRCARRLTRATSPSPPLSKPPPIANPTSSHSIERLSNTAPNSRPIPFAAVSANAITPPMNSRDAIDVFSDAALGFVEFREACETLRSYEEMDVFIRGLDAQFRSDIERIGCHSTRDLLRARFARLLETHRALYEYAIIDCRESEPASTISSTGRREETTLCRLHVRSSFAAHAIAEMVRREFAARPEQEAPLILIVGHEPRPHVEAAPQQPTSSRSRRARTRPLPSRRRQTSARQTRTLAKKPPASHRPTLAPRRRARLTCRSHRPHLRRRHVVAAAVVCLTEDSRGSRERRDRARHQQRREARRREGAGRPFATPIRAALAARPRGPIIERRTYRTTASARCTAARSTATDRNAAVRSTATDRCAAVGPTTSDRRTAIYATAPARCASLRPPATDRHDPLRAIAAVRRARTLHTAAGHPICARAHRTRHRLEVRATRAQAAPVVAA